MVLLCLATLIYAPATITVKSLLAEMTDRTAITRFPEPAYQSLEATSYNRASVRRDEPGWFADSDGVGFIRTEQVNGKTEWVIMEHEGPGCITKMWTPFFYYDFNNRVGPNVRVYLDGAPRPVIDEPLIALVTGKGSIKPPFAFFSARAGDSYLPIPFGRSCKVTMTDRPFYNSVNYRAYSPGTRVETFSMKEVTSSAGALADAAKHLSGAYGFMARESELNIPAGSSQAIPTQNGPTAISALILRIPDLATNPSLLRSLVLSVRFDGEDTVWCPIGDFFSSADSLHPFQTMQRSVYQSGQLTCNWTMPYKRDAEIKLVNLSKQGVTAYWRIAYLNSRWDSRTMHFHATWRPDDVVPGTPFQDWNFVDIQGKGVYVGDSWTVLNMQKDTWWGEGDEKIYVDDAWDKGFPTHFGTGSEDYYGWAGGVLPTRQDEFSSPFLANVRVGGEDGHTLGYNICTRTRMLDAIPFEHRLRFDMESSFGTDIRKPWNLLGYSAVTFWYARPGGTDNRPPEPKHAQQPIMNLAELRKRSEAIKKKGSTVYIKG